MNWFDSKILTLVFGFLTFGGLAVFLMLQHGSPGPLSASHAQVIKGTFVKSCEQCHTDQGLTSGCLNCHDEILEQIGQNRGYHAYLLQDESHTCQQCHPEHHGEVFPLVSALAWQGQDPNAFDHPHVAFKLTGHHDSLACADCHHAKQERPFTLSDFPAHQRGTTYLGLDQDCISCHEDIHAAGQAWACNTCHDQDAFKPASHFQHDDYFALEGVHAQAACSTCHLLDAQENADKAVRADPKRMPLVFRRVKGKTCVECHTSPHRTSWNQDCQTCHYAADLTWLQGERGIDLQVHAELGFALEGAHVNLACASCHPPDRSYAERFTDPSSPDYARQPGHCAGCHPDPHGEQFRERYSSCRACHTQSHFKPSTIDTTWHAQQFPLTEAHAQLTCDQCHPAEPDLTPRRFAGTPRNCQDCHSDPHGGQFQDRHSSCLECHHSDRFVPTSLGPARHSETYPLLGAHRAVACIQCHRVAANTKVRQFRSTHKTCKTCHADPHAGQFQQELQQGDCTVCHDSDCTTFQLRPYDHDEETGYPLTGAHAQAPCQDCHIERTMNQMVGPKVRWYRSTPTGCAACHPDVHRGQFQQDGQTQCERCHGSTELWTAENFLHERDARFALEGSHAKVTCGACHPAVPQKNGPSVIQYRPLSTHCEECHGYVSK